MMKKLIKGISLILVISMLFAVPVLAEETTAPYASAFFSRHVTYLYVISGNRIGVWFDVLAKTTMDELGVNSIVMQKSSDGTTWRDIKTFTPANYPVMIATNESYYANGVPYTGTYNYYYRAKVQFYAKDGNSSGTYTLYTSPLFLSA